MEICYMTQGAQIRCSVTTQRVVWGVRWKRGSRGRGQVYLWLIHVDLWQKPTQYCKAIILQLKILKSQMLFTKTHLKIMTQDGWK